MHARALAELALKVWSVIVILGALTALPTALVISSAIPANDPQGALLRASQLGYMIGIGVHVLAGIAVLVSATRIVALFESDTAPLQIQASKAELEILGFALVGIFVFTAGLQKAAVAAYVLFSTPGLDHPDGWSHVWARAGDDAIIATVQIVAGALLVVGREALARGWSGFRRQAASDSADDGG